MFVEVYYGAAAFLEIFFGDFEKTPINTPTWIFIIFPTWFVSRFSNLFCMALPYILCILLWFGIFLWFFPIAKDNIRGGSMIRMLNVWLANRSFSIIPKYVEWFSFRSLGLRTKLLRTIWWIRVSLLFFHLISR